MVGECIRYYRIKLNFSLEELANLSNVSKSELVAIESGKDQNPSPTLLSKIAFILGINSGLLEMNKEITSKHVQRVDEEWLYLLTQAVKYGVKKEDLVSLIVESIKQPSF